MTSESIDANAYTTVFMLTQSMRRDVYPAVDPAQTQNLKPAPKSPWLSLGVSPKAQRIALVGRDLEGLYSTAVKLETSFEMPTTAADVTSQRDIDAFYKNSIVEFGSVEAESGRSMVAEAFLPFSKDKAALAGGLTVYLSTPKADFLKGGYIDTNRDIVELEA
ncbi:hypothetical protein DL771_001455 [Monosporascus sp. 5C6A]|nr:hypothetical protein DL771_001455 [Monosporascus sp. 5C6A]